MRGSGDEIDQVADSLNVMLARNAELVDGLRQVTNDIAHDLRTPLSHLRQRLERIRISPRSPAEYEAAIDRSIADTDAILDTFSALLRIAEVESGAQQAAFSTVDLTEALNTVLEVYEGTACEKDQRIIGDIEPNLTLLGDRQLLVQMLANLLENAVRYTGFGGRIRLTARRRGATIRVVVADDGPGIPAAERERVFRRFYRLEASRTTPGSGLGLSLVQAVAEVYREKVGRLEKALSNPATQTEALGLLRELVERVTPHWRWTGSGLRS